MRTSTLAEAPSGHTPPVRARRHHRSRIVVATAALALLAIAAGAGVALLDRPSLEPTAPARAAGTPTAQPSAATSAQDQGGATGPAAAAPAATTAQPTTRATQDQGGADGPAAALADGSYPAFIRKIDSARRTMVVDVVQVFEGKAALQAGLEDGLDRDAAAYRDPYVRNKNPLLRTLPIARQATIQFMGTCEGPAGGPAALGTLAKHATTSEFFYYTLTVRDGSVRRIVEHQAQPAC
jgi:hypothetical protein